jgi:hypothetical protein
MFSYEEIHETIRDLADRVKKADLIGRHRGIGPEASFPPGYFAPSSKTHLGRRHRVLRRQEQPRIRPTRCSGWTRWNGKLTGKRILLVDEVDDSAPRSNTAYENS